MTYEKLRARLFGNKGFKFSEQMVVFGKKSVHIPVSTHKYDEKKNLSMQLTVSDEGMNNSQWNQLKYVHQTFLAVKTT
jgi:hypothetical protein